MSLLRKSHKKHYKPEAKMWRDNYHIESFFQNYYFIVRNTFFGQAFLVLL
jgi:hypothetical protein